MDALPARLLLALLVLLGTLSAARAEDPPPPARPDGGLQPTIGYSHFDVARAQDRDATRLERLAGLGRSLVKTVPIRWGRIEPTPPRGKAPIYVWEDIDRAVLMWQLAGLEPVLVLSPRSPWASVPIDQTPWVERIRKELPTADGEALISAGLGAAPPRPSAWAEWERFIGDLVERYDGDRRGDMPGLRRAVRFIQVLDRADSPSRWIGSPEQYQRLLHHAGLAAKRAFSGARIVHAAIDLRVTGFDPIPDDATWHHRVRALLPTGRAARLEQQWGFELIERTLEMPRLFDVLPQVGAANLEDDAVNLRHARVWLDRSGGNDVDVWLVDAALPKLGRSRIPRALEPSKAERQIRQRWEPVTRLTRHTDHSKAVSWWRRGRCYDLVRTYCTAQAAGAKTVLFFPRGDQRPDAPLRSDDAPALPSDFLADDRGPMWFAWDQLVGHLGAHIGVTETSLGSDARSVVFEVPETRNRAFVSVLLLGSRVSWAGEPGQPSPTKTIAVPLPNGRYVLESCRTGAGAPLRRDVTVNEGMLILSLGPAPLYVIPQD